jgi:hypothetical protein
MCNIAAAAIIACCADCIIGCIEGLVRWFNRYAYIEIGGLDLLRLRATLAESKFLALYGKPYIGAAKDVWSLMKDRGIDALVNDSLVGISK